MAHSPRTYPQSLAVPVAARPVSGAVRVPGSKSITNRALLIAGLADGRSRIDGALFSDDTQYLAESLRRLGVAVSEESADERFTVDGAGGHFPALRADLFTGNAGTATRFLVAAVCLGNGVYRIDGSERMRERPIRTLLDGLRQIGANIEDERGTGCPPVIVHAHGLEGGSVSMNGSVSSQYFSALMLAGPLTKHGLTIKVDGELVSRPFVALTAAVMRAFGAHAGVSSDYREIQVPGSQRYESRDYRVEPDATSASYFYAAAAITGGTVRVDGLSAESVQGDIEFVRVLERMGCRAVRTADAIELHGPASLRGIDVDMADISDTSLTLAAIAPFASSPVTIRGVAHSRAQETDRVAAMATELRKIGVTVDEHEDGWTIYPARPTGGEIATYDDHRMAMSFAVLGLRVPGITILDPGCVKKTFPDFWDRFLAFAGR